MSEFNIQFQYETPLLYKLKSEEKRLLKNIASNYMVLNYVKFLENLDNSMSAEDYWQ